MTTAPRTGLIGQSLPRFAQAAGPHTVKCRVKRDHQLLRLKSSATTTSTGGYLFSKKQVRRSATHETKLPHLLRPHQKALRL
ncbi:hypothetical protein DFAR_3710030 [Desulfarculales bacterium]